MSRPPDHPPLFPLPPWVLPEDVVGWGERGNGHAPGQEGETAEAPGQEGRERSKNDQEQGQLPEIEHRENTENAKSTAAQGF